MKRALVYTPYWDTGGGGEKYTAGVVQVLLHTGYGVEIVWHDPTLTRQIESRFGVDIHQAQVRPELVTILQGSWWQKRQLERAYDLFFGVSDGSVPACFAKKNILHFQVPFQHVHGRNSINWLKLKTVQVIVCNSTFTQQVIDQEFGCRSRVVYPPVKPVTSREKSPMILSVGRFDNLLHSKRHDVLIEAFKQLAVPGWRLVLAGGVLHGRAAINRLTDLAAGTPVELITNPDYQTLSRLYGEATIYWHAAGYGQDLVEHPERAEHFGITTVEAMSAGAVPLVFKGGGQTEIVNERENGFMWQTIEELVQKTNQLLHSPENITRLAAQAVARAAQFSEEVFAKRFTELIG